MDEDGEELPTIAELAEETTAEDAAAEGEDGEDAETVAPVDEPFTGLVKLTAKYFDKDIAADSYFSLRIPGFLSPRSTAETKSFKFTSYNADGDVLDTTV